jgi:hypothetical protein
MTETLLTRRRDDKWRTPNGPVRNRDPWERDVSFVWVRGHATEANNNIVDRLSRVASSSTNVKIRGLESKRRLVVVELGEMVEHERHIAVSAALAASASRADLTGPDFCSAWPRRTPRRSRLCSLPAHSCGACSRHGPLRTATFGQPGASRTLAARLMPTSSAAAQAVRRTPEPHSYSPAHWSVATHSS